MRSSDDILVCRLVDGKITFVHKRLWPALVRLADTIPANRLAQVKEIHTDSGRHVVEETPFPKWVPSDVMAAGQSMSEAGALADLTPWAP